MDETFKARKKAIVAEVLRVAGVKRQELAEKWLDKLYVVLSRIDEVEFGMDFLHNIAWLLDMEGVKDMVHIKDKVVENTLHLMAIELTSVMGRKRSKLHVLAERNTRETVLPDGRWIFRGYQVNIRRREHGFRIEGSFEKNDCAFTLTQMAEILMQLKNKF